MKRKTLRDALDLYRRERVHEFNMKPRTIVLYNRAVDQFDEALGSVAVADLSSRDVAGFLSALAPGCLPSFFSVVAAALRWCDANGFPGLARLVPSRRPRRPGRERYLSDDEYCRLWAGLHDSGVTGRSSSLTVAALRLSVLVPLRRSELVSLRWDEVDLSNRLLHLRDTKTGNRKAKLPRDAVSLLQELPRRNDYVFPGKCGRGHIDDRALARAFERMCLAIGLNDEETPLSRRVTLHTLRHSWASKVARDGGSLEQARRVLGHTTVHMTARYSHIGPDELGALVEAMASAIASGDRVRKPAATVQGHGLELDLEARSRFARVAALAQIRNTGRKVG